MKYIIYLLILFCTGSAFSFASNTEGVLNENISEDNGIATITESDLKIYSVGISSGGQAEIRMAKSDPLRQIIATTIDTEGAQLVEQWVEQEGLSQQITVKIENASELLPYENESFDFIYARLVLHYLTKAELTTALKELNRILKENGKMFVVVRSDRSIEATFPSAIYDPETGLTTHFDEEDHQYYSFYFHSEASIQEFLKNAGFLIEYTKSYDERLTYDFQRTKFADFSLIELLISKPANIK